MVFINMPRKRKLVDRCARNLGYIRDYYMKFRAKYIHRLGQDTPYYRTVSADNVNEATKLADRYARKNYIMAKLELIL